MQTQKISMRPTKARELWRQYKKHQHYSEPIDVEIRRTYQLIAQGRIVIRAIESIKAAGLDDKGMPKLAIVRADAEQCFWRPESGVHGGGGEFSMMDRWWKRGNEHHSRSIEIKDATWSGVKKSGVAIVPIIPVHLRPKRGLQNYHVLWEAEWERIVPRDPVLLRRIGRGDMWLVVAAWDLTEVERAALATRLSA